MSRVVRMLSRANCSDERTELGLLRSATKNRSAVSTPGFGYSSRYKVGAARDLDQRIPSEPGLPRQIEQQIAVHAREPRRGLGALEIAGAPVDSLGDSRQQAHDSAATIQVSLLPPPCDEFTTSEPRRSATRVSPPGVTQMRWP